MIEIIKNTKIDFMGKRSYVLVLSAIMLIMGIAAIVNIINKTANLGIDFVGGTAIQVKFNEYVPLEDIRIALKEGGVTGFDLQDFSAKNKVLITIKEDEETLGGFSEAIITVLTQRFLGNELTVDSTTEIGPKVGAEMTRDALKAIAAAIIGILIYIWWRFQFRFSIGATVATFHDVLAVLGFFYLMGKEINLILVSALLMIAGYSLTDTVVVFDRIRENMKTRYRDSVYTVINKSINEVLSRTIITSMTTFFSALALFIFGGEVIHDFALAIMLGIIIGTYSSVFVASPIVLMLKGKRQFVKKS